MTRSVKQEAGNWREETRGRGACAGFTLIEMVVVVLIVAIAAALVFPRLPAPEGNRLKSSARNLATGIRYLNDQAIVTKNRYVLHLNLVENSTRISKVSAGGEELPPDDQFMNRSLLEDGVTIEDVTVPSLGTLSESSAKDVPLPFGPGGNEEGITIHLKAGEKQMTVIAYPAGTKVKVVDGYQTLEGGQESKS
ncbi:MAG TPA: prepilin-type N-terminal cleavage/methylation domain-containing protein [Geomonas sp.]|nr:prepilin-type N-terminal cleavage/methylation domain-containing protein [Geomonas sp.]